MCWGGASGHAPLAEPFFDGCVVIPAESLVRSPNGRLVTEEWAEWGNPNEEAFFDYLLSYSPIDNVVSGATYPAMLIVSGLNDPRVA